MNAAFLDCYTMISILIAVVDGFLAIKSFQKNKGNTAQIAYRESHSKLVCRAASIIPSVRLAGRTNSGCQAGPVS